MATNQCRKCGSQIATAVSDSTTLDCPRCRTGQWWKKLKTVVIVLAFAGGIWVKFDKQLNRLPKKPIPPPPPSLQEIAADPDWQSHLGKWQTILAPRPPQQALGDFLNDMSNCHREIVELDSTAPSSKWRHHPDYAAFGRSMNTLCENFDATRNSLITLNQTDILGLSMERTLQLVETMKAQKGVVVDVSVDKLLALLRFHLDTRQKLAVKLDELNYRLLMPVLLK